MPLATPVANAAHEDWEHDGVCHDPNGFWCNTGKKLFDVVMVDHCNFDEIETDNLVSDNFVVRMSKCVTRCARSPPVSDHTKRPFGGSALWTPSRCRPSKTTEREVLQSVAVKNMQAFT